MNEPVTGDAKAILARGAERGVPLEEFGPVWGSARLRLSRASWQASTLEPFLSFTVPYASTSSGRLSEDAVTVALAALPDASGLRILELGAGSGIFARLFLDALQRLAPKVYCQSRYVVTDGSDSILAAQRAHGVFAQHEAMVEQRRLDIGKDWATEWPDIGSFDVILCSYVLDSLPFDFLAVNDTRVWRREVRAMLDESHKAGADDLRRALATGDPAALAGFVALGPFLSLQTRHVPVDRESLPHADTLPMDTEGETRPWVHCHGALDAIGQARSRLGPGGVLIFSDYGHLTPFGPHDRPEFQAYGLSVAVGVNFPQIDTAHAKRSDVALYKPDEEEGHLYTRVLQRAPGPDLAALVDEHYGAVRYQAMTAPVYAAREFLRPRMFETARGLYAKALDLQPRSWSLMQEIALSLLLANDEPTGALEMADLGLTQNPLSPDLWRARAEALLALGRVPEARAAADRAVTLSPGHVAAQCALATIALRQNRPDTALAAIAAGLTHDVEGDSRDTLLALQEQALSAISRKEIGRLLASVNPFRALDDLPKT